MDDELPTFVNRAIHGTGSLTGNPQAVLLCTVRPLRLTMLCAPSAPPDYRGAVPLSWITDPKDIVVSRGTASGVSPEVVRFPERVPCA